jgi:hypothetical protein
MEAVSFETGWVVSRVDENKKRIRIQKTNEKSTRRKRRKSRSTNEESK